MLHDSRTAPRACSYPYTPDCLALCTWVAAEDGDAAALSMVAAEAQSKQAAAAAAAAAMGAGPQSSSGGSGSGTPHTGGPGSSTFVPTTFASAQAAGGMFGQQGMMPAGMAGGFNPATALMHPPSGGKLEGLLCICKACGLLAKGSCKRCTALPGVARLNGC
jgi:hypothetical protein